MEDCWTNIMFSTTGNGHIQGYSAMPPISDSTDITTLMLTFNYSTNYSHNLTIGVMDDPNDITTFVPVDTFYAERYQTIYYGEAIFNNYTGTGKYVAFIGSSMILDNVMLMEVPPCIYPFPVTTEHITSNAADVVFTPRGTEDQWEIAIGSTGFNPNMDGTHQIANYYPFTLNGLTPMTTYDVFVRPICGSTTGSWSIRHTFTTHCPPITQIPYTENFDTYGTNADTCYPGCWFRCSNANSPLYIVDMNDVASSYAFTLPGALKLFTTSNISYSLAVMPELDPTINLQELQVSCHITLSNSAYTCALEVGVMDDPYDPSTFTPVQTISDPHNAIVRFFHYDGMGHYIAFKNNGNVCYIDDVVLEEAPPCGVPVNLAVTDILGTSALISWEQVEYGTEADYIVSYRPSGSTVWDSLIVSNHQVFLNGLLPETDYEVRMQSYCAEGVGNFVYAYFRTSCESIENVQIGNGSWGQAHVPVNTASHSYAQQLFTASELSIAGVPTNISAIELQYYIRYPDYNSDHKHYLELYMGTTEQETYNSATSWVPFNTLQQVFADTVQLNLNDTTQWVTIQFSTPYHYDGNGSLVLAALSNQPNSEASFFIAERTTENRSIFIMDENFISPGNDILQGTYDEQYRSNIRFVGCDSTASCPTPNLFVSVSGSDVNLDIIPGGTEPTWEIEYRKYEDTIWTSYGTVTTPNPSLTGLDFAHDYIVRVRAVCSFAGHSAWCTKLFSTECGTIEHLPFTENFDVYAGTLTYLMPNCWNRMSPGLSGNYWVYVDGSGQFLIYKGLGILPPLSDTIDASTLMLTFRASGSSASCEIGIMDDPSDLSTFVVDTVLYCTDNMEEYEIPLTALANNISTEKYLAFYFMGSDNTNTPLIIDDLVLDYIPSCWHPKNVTLDTAYGTTAVVSWTERSSASQWEIEYGPHGFTPGTGTMVTVYSNPATLTGLPINSYLDFYVRADCGNGDVSQWSHTCCSCTTAPCDSVDQCFMKVVLFDARPQTQGWSHYTLKMFSDGVFQRNLFLETTEPDTLYLPVCNNSRVAFLVDGIYVMEVAVSLYAPNGDILVENLSGSSSWDAVNQVFDTLYAFNADCEASSCVAPNRLTLDSVGTHEVYLDWEPLGDASSWLVEYKIESDTAWSSVVANTHPFVLTGLAAQTSYYVRVRAACGDGSASDYRSIEHFNTSCDGVMTHVVGWPGFNGGMPDYNTKYSYSQQIFTADELQGVEDISSFQLMNTNYYSYYVWDIYLGHTTKSNFQNSSDFIDPQSLSLVFSGTIYDYDQTPEHLVTFNLDSTFHYNGTDNLVLAVYNHVGENRLPNERWKMRGTGGTYQNPNNQSFHAEYYMNTPFELTTSSLMNISRLVLASKNYIIFQKCCATPYSVNVQPHAADTTATVMWNPGGGESKWVLEYRLNSAIEWDSIVCYSTSCLLTDLVPEQQYTGRLMAVCDTASNEGSDWVYFTFTIIPVHSEAYYIISSAGPGGTISPLGNFNVLEGYDVTFDIVADTAAGYDIQDVLVDDISQGPISTYTFYAVNQNHTIHAEFVNVGVEEHSKEDIVLYPNPTNGKINISSSETDIRNLVVYDNCGKQLLVKDVLGKTSWIDLSQFSSGIYFLHILLDNGKEGDFKVVKN